MKVFSGTFSLLFLPCKNICGVDIQSRPGYCTICKSVTSAVWIEKSNSSLHQTLQITE